MNEIEFFNYIRFFGCCAVAILMMAGAGLAAVFAYWVARHMLADVAGKSFPKLTRKDIADWRRNNKAKAYDFRDDI